MAEIALLVQCRVSLAKANSNKLRALLATAFRALFSIKYFKPTYFGFYKRLFKPFCLFKGVRKKIKYRKSIYLELDISDWIQQNLYFLNEYEEREVRFVECFLKEGDVFVDLGANIGLFSLVASQVIGTKGRVYAFEPGKESYGALCKHIKLNKAKNIHAEKLAVTDKEGTVVLHIDEKEANKGGASAYPSQFSKVETATTTSLDTYFAQESIASVALIKMDIEGGEYLALKGMQGILERYKPALLIELDPEVLNRTSFTQTEIEDILFKMGYKKYYLDEDGSALKDEKANKSSTNFIFLNNNAFVT